MRHDRLIEAGLELFGTVGYGGSSIEAICGEARVSTRNFYDHFATREDLLLAVLEHLNDESEQAVLTAVSAGRADVAEQARAGLQAFVDSMLGDERRARVNFMEALGASRRVESRRREIIHRFASIIGSIAVELTRSGALAERERPIASLALVGAVEEVLRDWVTGEERPPLGPIVEELVGVFVAVAGHDR